MGNEGNDPRVERVDTRRTVQARPQWEDSDKRRAAEAAERAHIAEQARRRQADQAALEEAHRRKEARWKAEKAKLEAEKAAMRAEQVELQEEIAGAAEREIDLKSRASRVNMTSTVITTTIAALTALGAVGAWAYARFQREAEERIVEQHRRERVAEELKAKDTAITALNESLVTHKTDQAKVNADQSKVNTVQLLRSQRVETMLEVLMRKEGRKPPEREALTQAECKAGLAADPSQCPAVP